MDRDTITRTGARAPGVGRSNRSHGGVALSHEPRHRARSIQAAGDTKDGRKPSDAIDAPHGQAPSDKPALEPYWGKPAVRNLRGDDGNVGIIRRPVRAIVLPDHQPVDYRTFQRIEGNPRVSARFAFACGPSERRHGRKSPKFRESSLRAISLCPTPCNRRHADW
jgi:hypothetical protein